MVRIPAWSNNFPLACRSRAIPMTLVGLCLFDMNWKFFDYFEIFNPCWILNGWNNNHSKWHLSLWLADLAKMIFSVNNWKASIFYSTWFENLRSYNSILLVNAFLAFLLIKCLENVSLSPFSAQFVVPTHLGRGGTICSIGFFVQFWADRNFYRRVEWYH